MKGQGKAAEKFRIELRAWKQKTLRGSHTKKYIYIFAYKEPTSFTQEYSNYKTPPRQGSRACICQALRCSGGDGHRPRSILYFNTRSRAMNADLHSTRRADRELRHTPFPSRSPWAALPHPILPPSIPPPPRCPPPRTHRPRQARSRRRPSAAAAPRLPAARRRPQGACATGREGGAPPPPGPGGGGGAWPMGSPAPKNMAGGASRPAGEGRGRRHVVLRGLRGWGKINIQKIQCSSCFMLPPLCLMVSVDSGLRCCVPLLFTF